ncbi:MAG: CopG family transcriptional regulator [Syntrophobacteraceae bacterium]
MVRTQVQLTDEQAALLKEMAHQSKESIAAIIRKALDQYLLKQPPNRRALYRQALATAGKHRAGVHDIATEHDRYLEEEYTS